MATKNALKSAPDSGLHVVKNPPSRRPSPKKSTDPSVKGGKQKAPNGVVDEVIIATAVRNRLATTLGFILGGFVPVGSFTVAHNEVTAFNLANAAPLLMVLGGLVYSAITVYQWGFKAFESKFKAFGFVVLIEGIMTLSDIQWLSVAALILLVSINGLSTGTKLALKRTL
jgi:hypothetical protein